MKTTIPNTDSDASSDAQIDALLSPEEDASIVDSLFTVSRGQPASEAKDVLERVLFMRLQARIARRMRQSMHGLQQAGPGGGGDARKHARSAA